MHGQQPSSRHHYIPKFLIRAFSDPKGFVYVYDKTKDKILDRPQSTKSVFFETDRNSFTIDKQPKSSILEEVLYQKLDDLGAKTIRKFQNDPITDELLSNENTGQLQFFLLNLFWRAPASDHAATDLIQRAAIKSEGITPDMVRSEESWNKILRSRFYAESIEQLAQVADKPESFYSKIVEFEDDIFVIGDNAVLYENMPAKFTDLLLQDYYFAVSSKRIFSHSLKPLSSFKREMALTYNALIIEQSKRYVASNNPAVLQDAVEIFKKAEKDSPIMPLKKKLFIPADNPIKI